MVRHRHQQGQPRARARAEPTRLPPLSQFCFSWLLVLAREVAFHPEKDKFVPTPPAVENCFLILM